MGRSPDRRQFLRWSGVTMALALAGCSRNGVETDANGGAETTGGGKPDGGTADGSRSGTENLPPLTVAESWPSYRFDSANTGHTTNENLGGKPAVRWRSEQPIIRGGLVVADGTVYAGAYGAHYFAAFDAATGRESWRFETGGVVSSCPAYVDGTVAFTTEAGTMHGLDAATGTETWQIKGNGMMTPTVADGTLFTQYGKLQAVDPASGESKWERTVDEANRFDLSGAVAVADGTVYVSDNGWGVHALDSTNGDSIWETTVGEGSETGRRTPPVVDTGSDGSGETTVFVGHDKQFSAIDATTGEVRWSFDASTTIQRPPAVASGTVIVATRNGAIRAFDTVTGEKLWSTEILEAYTDPIVVGDTVYVANRDSVMFAFDLASGTERWRYDMDVTPFDTPAVTSGVLYVPTQGGVVALQSADEV